MTLLIDASGRAGDPRRAAPVAARLPYLADVLVLVNLTYFCTFLTWGWGGRDARLLTVGAALLAPAFLVLVPWRRVSMPVLLLPTLVALGALVVVVTAPTGWAGRHDAGSYVYASHLFVLVAAWAADTCRRTIVLLLVAAAGAAEFAQGWLAYWGGGDPTALFQGTFYWHNQAGIFLAAAALASAAACCLATVPAHQILGWCLGPLCAAGVVFSTSRGALLALSTGCLLLLMCLLLYGNWFSGAVRFSAVIGAWVCTAYLLAGPPFFGSREIGRASCRERV